MQQFYNEVVSHPGCQWFLASCPLVPTNQCMAKKLTFHHFSNGVFKLSAVLQQACLALGCLCCSSNMWRSNMCVHLYAGVPYMYAKYGLWVCGGQMYEWKV
jgi:hypothetical protein